jgi:hypothetical protein
MEVLPEPYFFLLEVLPKPETPTRTGCSCCMEVLRYVCCVVCATPYVLRFAFCALLDGSPSTFYLLQPLTIYY